MNIKGKTVVLTGATGGIGGAMARTLAEAGAKLVITGRDDRKLTAMLAALNRSATQHCGLPLDISREGDRQQLIRFCHELQGGVDVLINNAGCSLFALAENTAASDIERLVQVNLVAPLVLSTGLLPLLQRKHQALIVNVGSVLGAIGNPGYSIYGASKAGLSRFSETLGRELIDSGVRVLQLNPRATDTDMNSEPAVALNAALNTASDPPSRVADVLIHCIARDHYGEVSIGWPERGYIKINAIFPGLVDRSFSRNLPLIRRYARTSNLATETIAKPLL